MSYGYFDDKNKEYVINRPDTPLAMDKLFRAQKISLELYQILLVVTVFIKMQNSAD